MPQQYTPKTDALPISRVKKIMKTIVDQGEEDRKNAYDAYDFFKTIVEEDKGIITDAAKKCMVDCLKLAKESRSNANKIFELVVELELAKAAKVNALSGMSEKSLDELMKDLD